MLEQIQHELTRIGADDVQIELDAGSPDEFVRVQQGSQFCFLQSAGFLEVLRTLPDETGGEVVRLAIA